MSQPNDCRSLEYLLAGYSSGDSAEMTPDERRIVEEHLAVCPACRKDAEQYRLLTRCMPLAIKIASIEVPEEVLERGQQRLDAMLKRKIAEMKADDAVVRDAGAAKRKPLVVPWQENPTPDEIQAFVGEVMERMRLPLHRVAHAILNDWHAAEDAVQESFVALIGALEDGSVRGDAGNWLWTVVRRKAVDHRRALALRTEATASLPAAEIPCDDPAHLADRSEFRARLLACLDALPERERAAVTLSYFEGMSYAEIASRHGAKERTIRNQCQSALARLRENLSDLE